MLQSTSTGPVIANAGLSGATAGSLRSWRREPAAQNLSRYRLYPFFGQLNCLAGPYAGLIAFILMARAIGNGVLSFGLVSIPVEIHSESTIRASTCIFCTKSAALACAIR